MPTRALRTHAAQSGVVFYDFHPETNEPQILLMQQLLSQGDRRKLRPVEHESAHFMHGIMGGKCTVADSRDPARTAAREVEEESHGLVPAQLLLPLLGNAPAQFVRSGAYAIYFVRLAGARALPQAYEARVAGGEGHGRLWTFDCCCYHMNSCLAAVAMCLVWEH